MCPRLVLARAIYVFAKYLINILSYRQPNVGKNLLIYSLMIYCHHKSQLPIIMPTLEGHVNWMACTIVDEYE